MSHWAVRSPSSSRIACVLNRNKRCSRFWNREISRSIFAERLDTGKTVTLQELHRGLHEARRSVVAVAPTASAVEELQKVGFTGAMTIARLLVDPVQQAELRGQVLIIDEAGMVSSQDMADLLALAKMKDARDRLQWRHHANQERG